MQSASAPATPLPPTPRTTPERHGTADTKGGGIIATPESIAGIKIQFYFGLNSDHRDQVGEEEFQEFLEATVSPLFPHLSVFNLSGHWTSSSTDLTVREPSRCVEILTMDTKEVHTKCAVVVEKYKKAFLQDSVLRVVTKCDYFFH